VEAACGLRRAQRGRVWVGWRGGISWGDVRIGSDACEGVKAGGDASGWRRGGRWMRGERWTHRKVLLSHFLGVEIEISLLFVLLDLLMLICCEEKISLGDWCQLTVADLLWEKNIISLWLYYSSCWICWCWSVVNKKYHWVIGASCCWFIVREKYY
jgi:hypothetical protein